MKLKPLTIKYGVITILIALLMAAVFVCCFIMPSYINAKNNTVSEQSTEAVQSDISLNTNAKNTEFTSEFFDRSKVRLNQNFVLIYVWSEAERIVYEVDWLAVEQSIVDEYFSLNGELCEVNSISVFYYSPEYVQEVTNNSQKNYYFGGYDLDAIREQMGDNFYFSYAEGGTTVNEALPREEFDFWGFFAKIAIGIAVIIVSAVITVVTFGAGSIACVLVTAAVLGAIALAGGAIAMGITMATGGSWQDGLNAFANGFMVTAVIAGSIAMTTTGACFVKGTQISTANGLVPIEDIRAGDKVLSYNEITGKTDFKEVKQTFVKETKAKVTVTTESDKIVTTPEHPFYASGKWVKAGQLRAGDILQDVNGKKVIVEQVQHELLESPLTVYNFEVADNHNYYVGGNGVLVHNFCGTEAILPLIGKIAGETALAGLGLGITILGGKFIGDLIASHSGTITIPTTGIGDNTQIVTAGKFANSKALDKTYVDKLTLPDISKRVYHFAYIQGSNLVIDYSVSMNYLEAYAVLIASKLVDENYLQVNPIESIQLILNSDLTKYASDIKSKKLNKKYIGIYTYLQDDAAKLAYATGGILNDTYEVHDSRAGSKYYWHFHDVEHNIHVWYGNPC